MTTHTLTADEAWRLTDSVALRPEPFGALAYDFGTRRLSFLKTPRLVDVVRRLATSPSVGAAMADAGVRRPEWSAYLSALDGLAASGMLSRQGDSP
jgi:mycofactocin biosynthesis protein MftB